VLVNWITTSVFLNVIGLNASILLCLLLVAKEFIRTANRPKAGVWMRRLDFAILPLLFVFGLTVIGRLISF
jgi:hypothetical protein